MIQTLQKGLGDIQAQVAQVIPTLSKQTEFHASFFFGADIGLHASRPLHNSMRG